MALLDDNLKKAESKPIPGQGRSAKPYSGKSGSNPDWEGGQQRVPVLKQDNSTGRFSRPTIDQDYTYQAFREKMLGPLGLGDNSTKTDKPDTADNYSEEQQAQATADANQAIRNAQTSARRGTSTNNKPRRQLPKINLVAGDIKAKVTASRITVSNVSWIGYTWFFVQLPLALLSILSLGIVSGIDSILTTDKTSGYTGVLGWIAAKAAAVVGSAVAAIAKFIGVDFGEIAFFIAMSFYVIILALGLITILTVYFQYITSGLKPTTGRGSGLKTGALLLAIIGYSTPLFNLFPFVFLWMAAVWYHPK
jgi:hypothetical protein